MTLNEEQKEWIEKALDRQLTTLQIKKKLKENRFTDKKIEEFVEYYDKRILELGSTVGEEEEKLPTLEEEEKFKEKVQNYFLGKEKMGFWEKREVKNWLKRMDKAIKGITFGIEALKKEYNFIIGKQHEKGFEVDKELKDLKLEIVDRIMDTKAILYIEDPKTGKEATKESLTKCSIDELIRLMEENVAVLKETVEGKIDKK